MKEICVFSYAFFLTRAASSLPMYEQAHLNKQNPLSENKFPTVCAVQLCSWRVIICIIEQTRRVLGMWRDENIKEGSWSFKLYAACVQRFLFLLEVATKTLLVAMKLSSKFKSKTLSRSHEIRVNNLSFCLCIHYQLLIKQTSEQERWEEIIIFFYDSRNFFSSFSRLH